MLGTPKLENRKEQPCLGIRAKVSAKDLGRTLPALHNKLADWMAGQSIEPVGHPFFRYLVIDLENGFEVEVGVPVAAGTRGGEDIREIIIPAGCYATLIHTGHFSGLRDAARSLLDWAEKNDVVWHKAEYETGEVWECRLETYLNVGLEKDPEKWQTELAFLTLEN